MTLFEVYSLFPITPIRAKGCRLWDEKEIEYLDLYGGHAVISVGHSHPHYVACLQAQLGKIGFYSNAVRNPLQEELAQKLGELSKCEDYQLFLVNSGAEANENALKLASFHTGKARVIAFKQSFHGRTSAAVAVTDNPQLIAPFNAQHRVSFCALNDVLAVERELAKGDVAAVIIEGIQGVGGIQIPDSSFMQALSTLTKQHGALLIVDEVQSGYGRSGTFFAHQQAGIQPDLITIAKGMGNGFPIGGVLIAPHISAKKGMLGTTFGGNYLAMAAAIAVVDIIKEEKLIDHAQHIGDYLRRALPKHHKIKEVRGKGLMLGIEFHDPINSLRQQLLFDKHIFTGVSGQHTLRILAPLCLSRPEADEFIQALNDLL